MADDMYDLRMVLSVQRVLEKTIKKREELKKEQQRLRTKTCRLKKLLKELQDDN